MAKTKKDTETLVPEENKEYHEINENDLENYFTTFQSEFYDGITNYDTREIIITGEIDEFTVNKYVMPIIRMNLDDDLLDIPVEERLPIRLYLNCYGGDVMQGLALINVIKNSKTPIMGINLSLCYSMGAVIFLACPNKFCYPYSTFLLHDGAMFFQNSTSKFLDTVNFHVNLQEKIINRLILDNSLITPEMLKEKYGKEWYITAEEAKQLGMVDTIIETII